MGFFVCFLRCYEAVTIQLTYDKDPELSYLQGQHANPMASSQSCKRILG